MSQESLPAKAVGVSVMEAEHQRLHGLLHEIQQALELGRENEVRSLLDSFEDVANLHFVEEESLMRLHAYPGYAAHQQEHDALIDELGELSRGITSGELTDAAEAAASLERWLMAHMKTTDATLEAYLEEVGIRDESEGG